MEKRGLSGGDKTVTVSSEQINSSHLDILKKKRQQAYAAFLLLLTAHCPLPTSFSHLRLRYRLWARKRRQRSYDFT
jgi:hypothetical protein